MSDTKLYIQDKGESRAITIENGSIQASDIAKITGNGIGDSKPLKILDSSLRHIAVGVTKITRIDAENGKLYYRGYDIDQLCGSKSFEEVCYCLIWGQLPSLVQTAKFKTQILSSEGRLPQLVRDVIRRLPRQAPSTTMIQTGISTMLSLQGSNIPAHTGRLLYKNNPDEIDRSIVRTLGIAQLIFAEVYCHRAGKNFNQPPDGTTGSFAHNLLLMIGLMDVETKKPDPRHVAWLETILSIYADHEMSCATLAFLTAASAHTDPLSCYLVGYTTLYGVIHGGALDAAYKMLTQVGSVENVPHLIDSVKQGQELLHGYGHRVYKSRDPRADILKGVLVDVEKETGFRDPLLNIAEEIDRQASQDPYFRDRDTSVNADLYTNFACMAIGIPQDMVCPLIFLSRLQGFLAHWREFMTNSPRIIRPRQIYMGETGRRVAKL